MAQNLSNLPIGAKIKFGKHSINGETAQPITWLVVAKNHTSTPAYPSNSVTLLAERIIDLRAFDASEPNNTISAVRSYGNNRYSLSNLDQWLNSAVESNWYVAKHSYDQSPNSSTYVANRNTQYSQRPGFLNTFSSNEINAILPTTIRVLTSLNATTDYEDITRKVFIPSRTEINILGSRQPSEGEKWEYFTSNSRIAYVTQQVINNTQSTDKPSSVTSPWYWLTRTKTQATSEFVDMITMQGDATGVVAFNGHIGVRPALNLSSSLRISDTTDSDGCYTTLWNLSPPTPTTFNVPTTIYGGKTTTISWSAVVDPDGDSVTYQLEQSTDGGSFNTLYRGTNLSYNVIVPYGTTSVQFRIKAMDSESSGGYNTSTNRTVVNNNAPTISGSDGNLGTKNSEFTQTYTIADSNSNVVTVTEAIDGVRVRSFTATLGATNTFSVTGATWLTLSNGSHTMTMTASDGIDSVVRTYTFVKSVNSFTVQTTTIKSLTTRPTRIKLNVVRNIPMESTFKVEVCNNAFDTSPVWEDATSSVTGGLAHVFSNTTKTSTNWGVSIRVTVNRNGGAGACYISSIGGNFE